MKNNYDGLAGLYDPLSRLFFSNAQLRAQRAMLPCISAHSSLLIVGGGTGWILEDLADLHPSGLTITYVEISEKMLALSRKRDVKENKITFVHMPIEDYLLKEHFDVILTPFLFDNFSIGRALLVFNRLNEGLKQNGLWLFTDFFLEGGKGKYWQRLMLDTMYLFFRISCNIEAKALVDMESAFEGSAYQKVFVGFWYGGFIRSVVYKK